MIGGELTGFSPVLGPQPIPVTAGLPLSTLHSRRGRRPKRPRRLGIGREEGLDRDLGQRDVDGRAEDGRGADDGERPGGAREPQRHGEAVVVDALFRRRCRKICWFGNPPIFNRSLQ